MKDLEESNKTENIIQTRQRIQIVSNNDENEDVIDLSHENAVEYRWEFEELKNRNLKVDNFMTGEEGNHNEDEESVYIPSFVSLCSSLLE
jgi:3-methyladenine DNA glycosylase Tag